MPWVCYSLVMAKYNQQLVVCIQDRLWLTQQDLLVVGRWKELEILQGPSQGDSQHLVGAAGSPALSRCKLHLARGLMLPLCLQKIFSVMHWFLKADAVPCCRLLIREALNYSVSSFVFFFFTMISVVPSLKATLQISVLEKGCGQRWPFKPAAWTTMRTWGTVILGCCSCFSKQWEGKRSVWTDGIASDERHVNASDAI